MRFAWLAPPPPPPPPASPAASGSALEWLQAAIVAHEADYRAVEAAFFTWVEASAAFLVIIAVLHIAVRIISYLGAERRGGSLPMRVFWASLFALFPATAPILEVETAELVGRFVRRLSIRRSSAPESKGKSGLASTAPELPRIRKATSMAFAASAAFQFRAVGQRVIRQAGWSFSYMLSVVLLDLAIAITAPVALGRAGPALVSGRVYGKLGLSALVAARVVAPLSSALRLTCEGILAEWKTEDAALTGGAVGARQVVSVVPAAVQAALWLLWAMLLASAFGINVSAMWSSLGWGGVLFGLALQHYAADVVGGFTLLADGRFALGDLITLGAPPGWTVRIRQVGLLQTRCTHYDTGFACAIPNATLVRAPIYNWERYKARRVAVDLRLDGRVAAAALEQLPLALLDAARSAARAAGFTDVTFNNEDQGEGAEIVDLADEFGVRVQLVVIVPHRTGDAARWKRVKSAVHVGMLRELERRGVGLGRRAERVLHEREEHADPGS